MVATLAEVMPKRVRTVGFSLAFSLAAAIFGGMTPMACTFLVEHTGNPSTPAFWLMFAAVCSLISSLYLCRGAKKNNPDAVVEPAKLSV